MPDPIRGCLQLISQWVLSYTYCPGVLGRVSALLFVLPPARFQSMEFERDENLCRFKSCPSSRLRHTGRNSAAYGNSRHGWSSKKGQGSQPVVDETTKDRATAAGTGKPLANS